MEGKVVKEGGTIVNVLPSDGVIFGNESVKFGKPTYILTIETNEGKYVIDVEEGYNN